MADRLEGANQLNEILFQSPIDSFPHRDNYSKITALVASHAIDIEALQAAGPPPAGPSAEVIASRDDQPDLQTAIRKADEILGDGVFENVVNEFLVKESSVPDDKVDVDTGEAIINGKKVLTSSVQVIDPANFSAANLERIDVVHVDGSGTVAVTTGLEVALSSGLAEPEQAPSNTVILAFIFLRIQAGVLSPFPPETIRNTDDQPGNTDSFIVPNLQRFFVQRDDTDPHRFPGNWLLNGAFLRDALTTPSGWTVTRGTLVKNGEDKFGDSVGEFTGDGSAGGSFFEQSIPSEIALRGQFVTFSVYLKLNSTTAKTGRITVVQAGDTPEQDFSKTVVLNQEIWQRVHVTGYIDNSVTAVDVRIELDITDPSSVSGRIDGAQFSIGKILTEFEYPETMKYSDKGDLDFVARSRYKDGSEIILLSGSTFTTNIGSTALFKGDAEFEGNMAFQFPPPFDIFANVRLFTRT